MSTSNPSIEPMAPIVTRMIDVYVDDRLIATCPVETADRADTGADRDVLLRLARQMLKDDGVLNEDELAVAAFCVRRGTA